MPGDRPYLLSVERFLAQPAVRAVAHVEADQLIAAPAHAEVLWRAQELRFRLGEGEHHRDRRYLLAALAVDVDDVGLELHERLAPRRGCTEPEQLPSGLHGAGNTTGSFRRGARPHLPC